VCDLEPQFTASSEIHQRSRYNAAIYGAKELKVREICRILGPTLLATINLRITVHFEGRGVLEDKTPPTSIPSPC
jgi:hypothetical protein